MSDLQRLTSKIIRFRDERDWKQFHKPKEMALSLIQAHDRGIDSQISRPEVQRPLELSP